MTVDGRLALIALGCLVEPGNRELGLLLRQHGPARALHLVLDGQQPSPALVESVHGRLEALAVHDLGRFAEEALEQAARLGARIVTPLDDEWPIRFADLARISRDDGDRQHRDTDPPVCLWVRGAPLLAEAFERSVAVVGSRAASSYGQHVAGELAYGLAARDWTVVSGGAFVL
jgi:DNA processing protein